MGQFEHGRPKSWVCTSSVNGSSDTYSTANVRPKYLDALDSPLGRTPALFLDKCAAGSRPRARNCVTYQGIASACRTPDLPGKKPHRRTPLSPVKGSHIRAMDTYRSALDAVDGHRANPTRDNSMQAAVSKLLKRRKLQSDSSKDKVPVIRTPKAKAGVEKSTSKRRIVPAEGKDGEEKSSELEAMAKKIQAAFRGKMVRNSLQEEEEKNPKTPRKHSRKPNAMERAAAAELEAYRVKFGKKNTQTKPVEMSKPTIDEIWEIATLADGNISAHLWVTDIVDTFVGSKQAGLDIDLAQFPGIFHGFLDHEPEDMAPAEVVHLCAMLIDDIEDELTILHVRNELHHVHEEARFTDSKDVMVCKDSYITRKQFRRLILYIADFMCISQEYVINTFLWVESGVFEISDRVAAMVISTCARKKVFGQKNFNIDWITEEGHTEEIQSMLEDRFTQNDFTRLCYRCQIVDARQKTGLAHSQLSELFLSTTRRMGRLLQERALKRPTIKHDSRLFKADVEEDLPGSPRYGKELCTRGRTEFSVLIEELFKAMPKSLYTSPLQMCLKFLEFIRSKDGGDMSSRALSQRRQAARPSMLSIASGPEKMSSSSLDVPVSPTDSNLPHMTSTVSLSSVLSSLAEDGDDGPSDEDSDKSEEPVSRKGHVKFAF